MSVGTITQFEKIYILAGRSAVAGLVGGLAASFIWDGGMSTKIKTPFGNMGLPVAFGSAVAGSVVIGEGINMLIPENKKQYWNGVLKGFLDPALASVGGVAVAYVMFPGSTATGYLKLAALAGASAMVGDYAAQNFLTTYALTH